MNLTLANFVLLYALGAAFVGVVSFVVLCDYFEFESTEAFFCAPFAAILWPVTVVVLICMGILFGARAFLGGGISIIGRISDWYYERKQAKMNQNQVPSARARFHDSK